MNIKPINQDPIDRGDQDGPALGNERVLRVGEVARLADVSVRTLHHYDRLGLVTPSERSEADYRLYARRDLERLQTVLFYKELGFPLETIRGLLADPAFDRRQALSAQRDLIAERALRLKALLRLIDTTITAMDGGIQMSKEEMFEVFGDFDPAEYEDEVKQRWGDTDAYKESTRRTSRYTKDDWKRYKAESAEILDSLAALMDAGVSPTGPRAMDVAERARLQIDTWFYPCSREMHSGLGQMYVADPRFSATYDKVRPGMAQYLCDAIQANRTRGETA
jgi:MerR family transcriptional regulator, thiopeptide resistance regulator